MGPDKAAAAAVRNALRFLFGLPDEAIGVNPLREQGELSRSAGRQQRCRRPSVRPLLAHRIHTHPDGQRRQGDTSHPPTASCLPVCRLMMLVFCFSSPALARASFFPLAPCSLVSSDSLSLGHPSILAVTASGNPTPVHCLMHVADDDDGLSRWSIPGRQARALTLCPLRELTRAAR